MEAMLRDKEKARASGRPAAWGRLARCAGAWCLAALLAACGGGGDAAPEAPVAPSAPVIVTQPAAQAVDDGAAATFSVGASGEGLGYQWQRNGNPVAGATAATFTLPAAALADDGARFAVVVRNGGGSVTSAEAVLSVRPVAPRVTGAPEPAAALVGRSATFTVIASGSAPLSYQWLRDGAEIPGATAAAYTTPALALADSAAVFSVRVANAAGSVTSAGAALTVTPLPAAPTIATQPAPAAVAAGQSATFSVAAQGTGPLTYQWRRDGVAIAGATGASYTTAALSLADSGSRFSVAVGNEGGSTVSAEALLTVTAPPVPTGQARLVLGTGHVVAIRGDGSIVAWGLNNAGQLGTGAPIAGTNARSVATTAVAVAAGSFESLALGSDGLLRGWGRKFAGTTIIGGDAAASGTDVPAPATGAWPGGVTHVVTGSGNLFALARRSDGTVWQMPGAATAIAGGLRQDARQVEGLPFIASLGAGFNGDPVALDADGNVWPVRFVAQGGGSWGSSVSRVAGVSAATSAVCAGVACVALDAAGGVTAFRTLGNGAPAAVGGLPAVRQIAATGTGFLALARDGRLWAWNAAAVPAVVAGLDDIAEVAGGLQTVLVRLNDGSVWGYGSNSFGQLGIAAPAGTTTPVQVQGIDLR